MKTQVSSRSTNQFEFQSSLDSLLPDLPSDLQRRISQRSQDLSFTPQTASLANSRNAAPMRKIAAGKLPSKLKFVPKSQGRFLRRTIIGTPNRDFLPGTNASDFIAGLAGNDIILAQGGNDFILAGSGDDVAFGQGGNDTFFQGSGRFADGSGNDFLIGGDGLDTADYSQLGQAITLMPEGTILKGRAGTDVLFQVESVIGARGQANAIDAATAGGSTSIDVDLGSDRLTVNGVPGIGSLNLTVKNFVNVTGTQQSDTITGDEQDNTFFGSTGDDNFNGGEGFDTVDYSDLGEGVSLKSQGVISKGTAGTDQIQNIESIIGAVGETNIIDGRAPGDGPVSFDIDLSENRLTTKGIPFLGDVDFTVENFSQVYGTGNDDTIAGDDQDNAFFGSTGDDTFYGSRGDDTFNGDEDSDTVDYSDLGQGVTLKSQGVISKGTAGTDQIENIESIIGAVGETNIIDGRAPGDGPVSFDIDLSENRLTTKGIPVVGDVQFNVENFSQIYGTGNDDAITGDNQRNRLFGGSGNDRLSGLGGNDVMRGGSGSDVLNGGAGRDNLGGGRGDDSLQGGRGNDVLNGTGGGRNAGRNEVDTLTGGSAFAFAQSSDKLITALKQSSLSGFRNLKQLEALQKSDALSPSSEVSLAPNFQDQDRFILGNSRSVFYQGDAAFGLTDYAYITDFQSGADTIQLNGRLDDYFLLGSSLIFQDNGSKGLDAKDDLVGVVGGSGFNLSGSDFRFVA